MRNESIVTSDKKRRIGKEKWLSADIQCIVVLYTHKSSHIFSFPFHTADNDIFDRCNSLFLVSFTCVPLKWRENSGIILLAIAFCRIILLIQRQTHSILLPNHFSILFSFFEKALAKFESTQKVTHKSGIEQEDALLNESAAKETSLNLHIMDLENEVKQVNVEATIKMRRARACAIFYLSTFIFG